MKGIATHDSCTGERPMWYSYPLLPFAKTQGKTIKEQYEAGCRLFDLRIKLHHGRFVFAHGGYIMKVFVMDIFRYLNEQGDCHVTITYEGTNKHQKLFENYVTRIKAECPNIKYGAIAIKKGKNANLVVTDYDYIMPAEKGWIDKPTRRGFVALDGKSWHSLIPVPWLWKKVKFNNPVFSEGYYLYVDFL